MRHNINIIVGSNGRLGNALIHEMYKKNNGHHVIPYFQKITNEHDFDGIFSALNGRIFSPNTNINVINCAAKTNVQNITVLDEETAWTNIDMPCFLARICNDRGYRFFQISTDYVFRENDNSIYTASKKQMEHEIQPYYPHIIRVANLFSQATKDAHNIISKLKKRISNNELITIDPNQFVFPCDVNVLSQHIINFLEKGNSHLSEEYNMFANKFTVKELVDLINFGYSNIEFKETGIKYHYEKMNDNLVKIDCTNEVVSKIKI